MYMYSMILCSSTAVGAPTLLLLLPLLLTWFCVSVVYVKPLAVPREV